MDTNILRDKSPKVPPDHDQDPDDVIEMHASCLERLEDRPHGCYSGVVYIGHLVIADDGEEVEVIEAVPCKACLRRCSA